MGLLKELVPPVVRYVEYSPRDVESVYACVEATAGGSVVVRPPLDDGIREFLEETLGADMALWNGDAGLRGMSYEPSGALGGRRGKKVERLTCAKLGEFMEMLRKLAEVGADVDRRRKLRKELERHAKISGELDGVAEQLKRKVSVLERIAGTPVGDMDSIYRGDSMTPSASADSTGSSGSAEGVTQEDQRHAAEELREANGELLPIEAAIRKSIAKTIAIREELEEFDTADARRTAILERLFGHDPAGCEATELLGGSSDLGASSNSQQSSALEDRAGKAVQLATYKNAMFVRYHRIFRVLVDAKKGVVHLYALEGALKSILQNLNDAMLTTNAGPHVTQEDVEKANVSPSFRLRYVRQLREGADSILVNAIHYSPFSSLSEKVDECTKGGRPTLLADFTKSSLLTAFSTKETITGLYDKARRAYKKVNIAYDMQLALVKQVVVDLNQTSKRLEEAEWTLSTLRCRMLLSRSINEKLFRTVSRT